METFEIEIIESKSWFVKIKAKTKNEAMKKTKELYHDGNIDSIAQSGSCDPLWSPNTKFRFI